MEAVKNGVIVQLGKTLDKASVSAMNRAAQMSVTAISRFIRERYNIKKSELDEHIKILRKASADQSYVTVKISRGDIALYRFNATQIGKPGRPKKGKGPRTNQGVKATVEKGKRLLYRSSDNKIGTFIATMKSGHTGVFIREMSTSTQSKKHGQVVLKERYGVNLLSLVSPKSGKGKVKELLESTFYENYQKRLQYELDRRGK